MLASPKPLLVLPVAHALLGSLRPPESWGDARVAFDAHCTVSARPASRRTCASLSKTPPSPRLCGGYPRPGEQAPLANTVLCRWRRVIALLQLMQQLRYLDPQLYQRLLPFSVGVLQFVGPLVDAPVQRGQVVDDRRHAQTAHGLQQRFRAGHQSFYLPLLRRLRGAVRLRRRAREKLRAAAGHQGTMAASLCVVPLRARSSPAPEYPRMTPASPPPPLSSPASVLIPALYLLPSSFSPLSRIPSQTKTPLSTACGFSSAITLTGMDRDEGQGECVREESMLAWSCSKALIHSQMLTRATCADVRVPARRLRSHEHRLRRPEAGSRHLHDPLLLHCCLKLCRACVLEGSELTLPTMWCTLPINPQKKKARDASHHKKAAPVWQSYQNSIDTADSASAEGVTANMHV